MVLDNLKTATSGFHSLAEKLNFSDNLRDGTISKAQYMILLKRLYAYFSQASLVAQFSDDAIINDKLFESKITLLKNDLVTLGVTDFGDHIVFDKLNYYDSIGFCYVPLGSMLGGKIIYNSLLKMQAHDNIRLPVSFYESCKDAYTSWSAFCLQLNLIDKKHHSDILNGAKSSYLHFLYLCLKLQ